MEKAAVTITAIICITIVQIFSAFLGYNGAAVAATITVIAGLGGYHLAKKNNTTK